MWNPFHRDSTIVVTKVELDHKKFMTLAIAMFTLVAFMLGFQVWQNIETSPRVYCTLAKVASPEMASGCVSVLIALIGVKDHNIIANNIIIGLVVLSLAVVLLGVRIRGSGPNGMGIDVGADKTVIDDGQGTHLEIPTPPSSIGPTP